jgi:hypothetical protein
MNMAGYSIPSTLALFEKRIDGDDALMELAHLRFRQAGMGSEMHAPNPEQLEMLMRFRSGPESPVVVHLSRHFNVLNEGNQQQIVEFATRFAGRIRGLVIHDHTEMISRAKDFKQATEKLDTRLKSIERSPTLFIEYAAGLAVSSFEKFFQALKSPGKIGVCIDIGHVGIQQARNAYGALHPGQDICALKSSTGKLPQVMSEIDEAVITALPIVLKLVQDLATVGCPLHFHLHDGHPLSTFSPFGVSDHLSFFAEIPIPFAHRGRHSVPLMFGPDGLARIVRKTVESANVEQLSFTLEIHPTGERLSLGEAASLFEHWRDKNNAEQMNHWLAVLSRNHALLLECLKSSCR